MRYKEICWYLRKKYLKRWYKYVSSGKTCVYVDESGFEASSARRYGYARRGQKVYGQHSGQKRPRTTLIAAQINGCLRSEILFQGTTNAAIFNHWLKEVLCPKLNKDHVVIMDNAAFHKSNQTKHLIENTGASLLFLPPYSPDLNPIEQTFGLIKRKREIHTHATIDDIINMLP